MPDTLPLVSVSRPVSAARISAACERARMTPEDELEMLRTHSTTPFTEDSLLDAVTERYARSHAVPAINNSITVPRHDSRGLSDVDQLRQRMAGAIGARLRNAAPPEASREFMGATMIDMARGLLIARGERAQYMSPAAVFERHGAMTTSDFPLLLAAPIGAYLNDLYKAAAPALQTIARARTTRDFKPITGLRLEGGASLDFLPENGEYTYGAFSESGQQYSVKTFGKMFSLSRQAIINDNLGAFVQGSTVFVRGAANKRADFLAAIINTNAPIMAYGPGAPANPLPLFDLSRGNLASVGSALSVTSLSAARRAMRAQKEADGTVLDVTPRFLVVGPELETEAEIVLTQLAAAAMGDVNPFAGKLTLVVDTRIFGRAWYLFANPGEFPVLEYATLEGAPDVFTDTRQNWEVDGIQTKVRIDFGAAPVDYRGGYKNPGA